MVHSNAHKNCLVGRCGAVCLHAFDHAFTPNLGEVVIAAFNVATLGEPQQLQAL